MTLASSDIPLRPRCLYEMELHTLANVSDLAVPAKLELMQIHHSYFPQFWRRCMPAICASNYKTTSEAFITDRRISGAFRAGRIRKDR